jgi:hypothetical protein
VAQEIHGRGLRHLVETGLAFTDPQYSRVAQDCSGLSLEEHFRRRSNRLALIADEVRPNYLSIGSEPTTETIPTDLTPLLDEYLWFFWSDFFFGYLDFSDAARNLSALELYRSLNQTQYANLRAGLLSQTGQAYRDLIGGSARWTWRAGPAPR